MSIQASPSSSAFIRKPTFAVRLRAHMQIMRLDHSIKNIFVLPGIIVPLSVLGTSRLSPHLGWNLVVGFVATTLIACSNYVLNEVLDAPFDRLHPKKKNRPHKGW
jgi:4-hydroxybenzoate polyprenyltransferase